ncbi:MAG: TCP-1/cpn60 chaperonin family protein [Candidatus Bathyarchaeia archaeon]
MIFDKVRGSLGPRGGYKMVTYHRGPEQVVKISKDIIPALEEWGIQHPAASLICEAAKMQREEYGDGVTQFTILVSALIMAAEKLRNQGLHPNKIVEGYKDAARRSLETLEGISLEIDECSRGEALRGIDCGRGLLTGRLCEETLEASTLARTNGSTDPDKVRFLRKRGGESSESRLINGVVLIGEKAHPGMPDSIEEPRIALLSGGLAHRVETKMRGEGPTEIEITITSPQSMKRFRDAELEEKRTQVARLGELGVNVLLSMQPLDDAVKGLLTKRGIFAVDRVKKEDIEAVADATGAGVTSGLSDLSSDCLGRANRIGIEDLNPEKMIKITGCVGASFLLRGSTENRLDELEGLIKNALKTMKIVEKSPRAVPGGGAAEMEISGDLSKYALGFSGKEQLVVEKFAEAVEEIPRSLAINYGLDEVETIAKLRSSHEAGRDATGIGLRGCSEDVCLDILRTKKALIARAANVATMMLNIDTLMISNEIAKFHKK